MKHPIDLANALQHTPLFASLSAGARETLLAHARRQSVPAGQWIFHAGKPATRFFLVLVGCVRVFQLAPSGEEQTLHTFKPTQTIAEAPALKQLAYPANAQATEPTELLAIDGDAFLRILSDHPAIVADVITGLTVKLHELATLVETLSLKSAPARVATALLDEQHQAGVAPAAAFTLSRPKQQIAAQLGLTPETVSRCLKRFTQEHWITQKGRQITIQNPAALQNLANGL